MCGIVGIKLFHREPEKSDRNFVESVLDSQSHRGPDFQSVQELGRTVLGHNRLAILDLNPRSNQPFFDPSGRFGLVFNGEIYNYPELKNGLLQKGIEFSTSSDTEVLLYYLMEHGEKGIADLDGCFSFAFMDGETDELILARDPMGVNPLLFSMEEDRICFSSELWPFMKWFPQRNISVEALNFFFQYTYVPAPLTMLEGVQKLLPGHYLKVQKNNFDLVNYFQPATGMKSQLSYHEACVRLKQLVEDAVLKRMEADVPLGTFLSGGLDSSIVSGIAAHFRDGVQTYSIGFSESSFFDESDYAKAVAVHIESQHHAIQLSSQEVQNSMKSVLNSFDEPFGDSSAIAMFFLSKYARKGLTVCLSGDGADELFAGYNKHKAYAQIINKDLKGKLVGWIPPVFKGNRNSRMANKWRQIQRFKELSQLKWPESYWYLARFNSHHQLKRLLLDFKAVQGKAFGTGSLGDMLLTDQHFVLPNDMLKKVDIMSMRHSLEVRVPFLDKAVVHFANSIPDSFKIRKGQTKAILRDAFHDLLPPEIFERSKKGFEVPLSDWLLASWSEIVEAKWFDQEYIKQQGIFDVIEVKRLETEFLAHKIPDQATLMWCYLVFQQWFSNFKGI